MIQPLVCVIMVLMFAQDSLAKMITVDYNLNCIHVISTQLFYFAHAYTQSVHLSKMCTIEFMLISKLDLQNLNIANNLLNKCLHLRESIQNKDLTNNSSANECWAPDIPLTTTLTLFTRISSLFLQIKCRFFSQFFFPH